MRRRKEALAKAKLDEEQAKKDNEKRKQDRRAAREKRAKDQKKEAMKQEIRKQFVMHTDAAVTNPAGGAELLDVHGGYQKNAPFLGGLGGQMQQLYYVVASIYDNYEADY
jgi:membrane protein involved in colicin uptake